MSNQHENYHILNLIGYGLAKFNDFTGVFGFSSKTDFYKYCVKIGIAKTEETIKNRQDLFNPFFDNGRRGWWQKGNAYMHRKVKIDNLFGDQNVADYVNLVKLCLQNNFQVKDFNIKTNPLIQTRFKQMQETGLEAELFFIHNYHLCSEFQGGKIEDARLYGDGYDFQISVSGNFYLAEVKGIRKERGKVRITGNEYKKAKEYGKSYFLTVVLNLDSIPFIKIFPDPLSSLDFKKTERQPQSLIEYQLINDIC